MSQLISADGWIYLKLELLSDQPAYRVTDVSLTSRSRSLTDSE